MHKFIKLDSADQPLPDDATDWAAVLQVGANLIWSKDDVSVKDLTAKQADKACAEFQLNGHKDWRLPSVEELFCLADRSRQSPAIDVAFFPDCKCEWYWSATPVAWRSGARWVVSFDDGGSSSADGVSRARVRAVRSAVPGQ